ncbi:kinase-like domain-containing protein [Chaetomium strumarium]|uniref:non-specific serine/threonine protein kinase n=1 Tax=Chaetomium strumarium TaxID=1170767 RepID=A0AAJ0GSD6_9PEZI|nr:kinase-like domain-containing protein [Chaetomium strumarium]
MSSQELSVRQINGRDNDPYYKICWDRKLGEGGFGAVYEAKTITSTSKSRTLACKVVKLSNDQNKFMYQARELKIWYKACRNAQHVAQFYDAALNRRNGEAYIYMELLAGGDTWKLSDRIQAKRDFIHPTLLSIIAYQAAYGLYEIHAKDIQHRDLKPDNLLMTRKITAEMNRALWDLEKDGRPKDNYRGDLKAVWNILHESRLVVLTDFGLARDHTATSQGRMTVVGGGFSSAWNAPEVLDGNNKQTQYADVFSFGMIIYILASFHLPQHVAERGNLPKVYSASLQTVYRWCTDDTPEKRPIAWTAMNELKSIKNAELARISKLYNNWEQSERQAAAASSSTRPAAGSSRPAGNGTACVPQAQGGGGGGRTAEHQRLLDAELARMAYEREQSEQMKQKARLKARLEGHGGGGGGGGSGSGTGGVTQAMGQLRVGDGGRHRDAGHTPYHGGGTSQPQSPRTAQGVRYVRVEGQAQGGSSQTGGGSARTGGGSSSRVIVTERTERRR